MATPAEIVAKIDTKISAILDDPNTIASYRIGNKSVSRAEILRELRATRETYQTLMEKTPYEDIRHVAYDLDDFGQEVAEYIGDDLETG